MRKLRLLVDADDTIEGLLKAWIEALNWRYYTDVQYEDVTDWSIEKFFPSLTQDQVYRPLTSNEFWGLVRPIDGAVENLSKLHKDGHEIYIVTASDYRSLKGKMERLVFKYFPFIDWEHVIVASNKCLIRGDILIDDAPHNLVGGEYKKFLVTAPHNQSYDAEANGMRRFNTWDEIYEAICEEANS